MRGQTSLLLIALLSACATPATPSVEPWPIESDADVRPDAMVVEPEQAESGELVAVRFPGGWERGILYALDAEVGDGWERRWMLISDASGGEPLWFVNGQDEVAVEAIGIVGEGPDRILIPDESGPGDYRVCTANAAENVCTPIEIVAP